MTAPDAFPADWDETWRTNRTASRNNRPAAWRVVFGRIPLHPTSGPSGHARGGLQALWRFRLGWIAGHSLVVVMHVGRRTGKQHPTVLCVQRFDRHRPEATVISVSGESQWLRNIGCCPAVQVEIARRRHAPDQQFLAADEIFELEQRFRRCHSRP